MGNKGSISVINRKGTDHWEPKESVSLFLHWGGDSEAITSLVEEARTFMKNNYRSGTEGYASEVIALLTRIASQKINSSAYLGVDMNDGDNSDNGHFLLEIGIPHEKLGLWQLKRVAKAKYIHRWEEAD